MPASLSHARRWIEMNQPDLGVPAGGLRVARPYDCVYNSGMTSQPWYKDGLSFTCTQCGNCCTGFEGYVWVNDEELAQIADYLKIPVEDVLEQHARPVGKRISLREKGENHDCTFFDPVKRGCTIYSARPRQCRTWPFWRSNLESPATWKEVQETCPGAGTGTFFSLEQIEAQAAVFRL